MVPRLIRIYRIQWWCLLFLFQTANTFFGQIWSKKSKLSVKLKFGTYNPGHNILELYNMLVQARFITSKRKLDIQCSKLGIQVAERVAERLKGATKLLFLYPPQNQAEAQPSFETAIFQGKFTLWYIRTNIYIWKTKFTSH